MLISSRFASMELLILNLLLSFAAAVPVQGAEQDNSVEWNGISHIEWQDRRPLCPIGNEPFSVRFQSYENDLTSARVYLDDGGSPSWIVASVIGQRGSYDIWQASVPATSAIDIGYFIELTDGGDTDYLSISGMSDGAPVDGGWRLNFATYEHAPVGATLVGDGCVFKVWAPGASSCHVRGDFNNWSLDDPMTRVGEYFIQFVTGAVQGQEYKYYFSPGDIWKPDPRGRAFNASNNMNSIIENPFGYQWQEDGFRTPPQDEMIVYQLHIGTFAGRNDPYGDAPHPSRYTDVAARVEYLAALGVNTVMINPATEFPGDNSAGYNPITQWAPEWAYGSADDFKYMIDVLHQNGIALILDIVWNHFSFSDNFLWYYDGTQIYFDDPAVDTPWGSQADFGRQEVREYFLHSALHWLEEYRIDGLRMDATGYMNIQTGGWSLMQEMNDLIDNRFADKVVIAEQLPDDSWVTRPTSLGGAGFDAQYYDYFTDSIREEILDAAFGDPEMWKIRDIINGSGQYLQGSSVFNYLELHDEAWPSSGGQRIVKVIDTTYPHDDIYARGRVKLAQGIVTLAPGIPAFLMGLDWLEDTDFGTGIGNRIDWAKRINYDEHLFYFRDLLALRANPAFGADAARTVHHMDEGGNVIGFRRWDAENDFVVIANFSNTDYTEYRVGVPQNVYWREALNSQHIHYAGSGQVNGGTLIPEPIPYDGYDQSLAIVLPKMAFVVLQAGIEQTGVADDATPPMANGLEQCFPNPFNPTTTIRFSLAESRHAALRIYDASGRLVRTLVDRELPRGRHAAIWDGRNDRGTEAASGVYFYCLVSGGFTKTHRMVLLR